MLFSSSGRFSGKESEYQENLIEHQSHFQGNDTDLGHKMPVFWPHFTAFTIVLRRLRKVKVSPKPLNHPRFTQDSANP